MTSLPSRPFEDPAPHFIAGHWQPGSGAAFRSIDPATGDAVWSGRAASADEVNAAVESARAASFAWSELPLSEREQALRRFEEALRERKSRLAEAISLEIGKPLWESLTEAATMISKIGLSIEAQARRCASFSGGNAITRFRPHGVVSVFGPFNFPGHLPNGHIVPALLAGNTVVFKPSEQAPLVARRTVELWQAAGLPAGVLNLVQGGRETGAALAAHRGIDGLFFTGSAKVGNLLAEQFAKTPERILALEMGGNNPLVVHHVADPLAAAYATIQSAYLSAGQRCTCARRLIVPRGEEGDRFIDTLIQLARTIRCGPFTDQPEPFMGPVVSASAADSIANAQAQLITRGGRPLLELQRGVSRTGFVSPGLIDMTDAPRDDEEVFGPLLQLARVADFRAAMEEANRTSYGLAAGLLSDDAGLYEAFRQTVRAGIVNWNQPLTGASGAAPFGGIGRSGNHRPSAFFAADYCSYPVASIEVTTLARPAQPLIGVG
jgi:succinylglutamic semialdehyde dehydrogenase